MRAVQVGGGTAVVVVSEGGLLSALVLPRKLVETAPPLEQPARHAVRTKAMHKSVRGLVNVDLPSSSW